MRMLLKLNTPDFRASPDPERSEGEISGSSDFAEVIET